MRARVFVPLAAIAVLIGVAVLFALSGRQGGDASPTYVTEHPVAIPASVRTVVVSRATPMPSAHERLLSAKLEDGTMPHRSMMAEVLTDTDCAPDAQMISHCRNVVRLEGGGKIVLRHPHDMTRIPCLAPGERVRLLPNDV
jgi:hypothetical protein